MSTLRLLPSARQRRQTLEVLRSVQGPTQARPGCLACRIYAEEGAEAAILFVERWASQAAFDEHIRSEAYRRILAAIELSSRPPEIHFDHVSTSQGMELIEQLRHHPLETTPYQPEPHDPQP